MILYIRVSRQADADLYELYKYIPHGLGKIFKAVLLDYFKYYDGEEYKFEMPKLKKLQKELEGSYSLVTVNINDQEKAALEGLFSLPHGGKSSFIKNLTRMYMGKNLAEISRPLCGETVGKLEKKETITAPIEINSSSIAQKPKKPIFTPQEF